MIMSHRALPPLVLQAARSTGSKHSRFFEMARPAVSVLSRPLSTIPVRPPVIPAVFNPTDLKKAPLLFQHITDGVKDRIKTLASDSTRSSAFPAEWDTATARKYQLELMTNMVFAKEIATHFMKAGLGLPTKDSAKFVHLLASICVGPDVKITTAYRTPILVKQLLDAGKSMEEIYTDVAKAFFSQYHGHSVFNPMVRTFYDDSSSIIAGSNDLGRGTLAQVAQAFARQIEGQKQPTIVINFGDTGVFTQNFMDSLTHLLHAQKLPGEKPKIVLSSTQTDPVFPHVLKRKILQNTYGR